MKNRVKVTHSNGTEETLEFDKGEPLHFDGVPHRIEPLCGKWIYTPKETNND